MSSYQVPSDSPHDELCIHVIRNDKSVEIPNCKKVPGNFLIPNDPSTLFNIHSDVLLLISYNVLPSKRYPHSVCSVSTFNTKHVEKSQPLKISIPRYTSYGKRIVAEFPLSKLSSFKCDNCSEPSHQCCWCVLVVLARLWWISTFSCSYNVDCP